MHSSASSLVSPLITRVMGICSSYGGRQMSNTDDRPHRELARSPENLAEKTLLKNPMSRHGVAQKEAREVNIDKSTSIPFDLYLDMMKAGDRAKNYGQHHLRGIRSGKPHLVITK